MDQSGKTKLANQVERSLKAILGLAPPVDSDGDWMVPIGGRTICVQALMDPAPHAHIFTPVAANIGAEALQEIADLNAAAAWAKILRTPDGHVFAIQRVHTSALSTASLRHALMTVSSYATQCGPLLQAVYQSASSETPPPGHITTLPKGSVFVFGSNELGEHRHGAARTARTRFGARWGRSEGLVNQSYAIPTGGGFEAFSLAVWRFLYYATKHAELTFHLTRVGCGRAGFDEQRVADLFSDAPSNVIKPPVWAAHVQS